MSAPDDVVLFEVTEAIARIRFNRPAALNAIDEATAEAFHSACEAVSRRTDVRVIGCRHDMDASTRHRIETSAGNGASV